MPRTPITVPRTVEVIARARWIQKYAVGWEWSPWWKARPLVSFQRFFTKVVQTIQDHTPKATRNQETRRLSFIRTSMGGVRTSTAAGGRGLRAAGVRRVTWRSRHPGARADGRAGYVLRVATTVSSALKASAASLTALLLGGSVLAGTAQAAPATAKTPSPPSVMSKVGGDRLSLPGTQVNAATGVPALPKGITARSWIVTDAETGEILAEHNAHWKLAPASTLKMLLADMLIPKLPASTVHKVVPSDLKGMGEGSSLVGVKENLTYTVKDLWLGVFLRSGNDAVHVLSAMNGGVPATVADMNAEARELQADDTHVVSPDGYDMPGQASSAYDLTLFARAGLQIPEFREYCSTLTAQFPGDYKKVKNPKKGQPSKVRESFQIQNTDRLLSGDYDLKPYQGIAGVKNGDTTNAGATYTGVAQRDGRKLLVTVMHPDPKSGHNAVYREAASLLDWGFKAAPTVQPVGTLVPPLSQVAASKASAQPSSATPRSTAAAAPVAASSSSRGLWTAAGITAATLVLLAAVIIVVRRRRPLPSAVAASGASPTPVSAPAQRRAPDQEQGQEQRQEQSQEQGPRQGQARAKRPRGLRKH